jgi:hypothetical protein
MRLPSYLALFACVGGGYLLISDKPSDAPTTSRPVVRSAKIALPQVAVTDRTDTETPTLAIPSDTSDEPDEEIRGFTSEGPDAFAMVFDVDGVTYLRLSQEETATAHGSPRMTETDGVTAVVAPVGVNALPAHFQKWAGRTVLVDGECRARVVGFAEVSRVTGEAGDPWAYDEDGNPPAPTPWTVELVRESNVTLAAKLDGCFGTWARAETESAAAIAATLDEPELESAALADLLAESEHDLGWKEMGGEGDWRDHVDVTSLAWQHPQTEEKWVFVQARHGGSCGEASISLMTAYRVGADGNLRRAAGLDFAHDDISQVVDLDGDGQPELIMNDGVSTTLVDLANEYHESIHVPNHSHGCGC